MNVLKKFQEFALSADEQKSLKGGRLAVWKCMVAISATSHTYSQGMPDANAAIAYCDSIPNCMGCSPDY